MLDRWVSGIRRHPFSAIVLIGCLIVALGSDRGDDPRVTIAQRSQSRFGSTSESVGNMGVRFVHQWEKRDSSNLAVDSPVSAGRITTIPIESVRVGMRVPAVNPEPDAALESAGGEPDAATWRLLVLRHRTSDGGVLQIRMLRPIAWLHDHELHVGGSFQMDLPEMGVFGDAVVESMEACPEIREGPGHVVTATFAHPAPGDLLEVTLSDGTASETLGVTANHRFWNVDHGAFLPIGHFSIGDRILTREGRTRTLVSLLPRPGPTERVFNIEVHGEHVYYVGQEVGCLVHNSCPIREFETRPLADFSSPQAKGDGLSGHELLQSGWLRKHYGINRNSSLGRRNPAIALTEYNFHKTVTALQAEAGLHSPRIIAQQTAIDNVLENLQILKESGVPRAAIFELLISVRKFLLDNNL